MNGGRSSPPVNHLKSAEGTTENPSIHCVLEVLPP